MAKGTSGHKRHLKTPQDALLGITKPAVRRLARRGGVKRLSNEMTFEIRSYVKLFLEKVAHDAVVFTKHGKRSTVTTSDVVHSLKRNGRTLYV